MLNYSFRVEIQNPSLMHLFISLYVSQFPYYLLPYGVSEGRLGLSWLGKPKGTDELSGTQDTYLLSYNTDCLPACLPCLLVSCPFLYCAGSLLPTCRCSPTHHTLSSSEFHWPFHIQKTHTCMNTSANKSTGSETNAHGYFRKETCTGGAACAVAAALVGTAMRIGPLSWRG